MGATVVASTIIPGAVTYVYSLSLDFPHGLDESLLGRQIKDAALSQPLLDLGRRGDPVDITFAAALSPPEIATLDGLVAVHDPVGFTFEPRYREEEYDASTNVLLRRTFYALRVGPGLYKYKTEDTFFTYTPPSTIPDTEKLVSYDDTGVVKITKSWVYIVSIVGGSRIVQRDEI